MLREEIDSECLKLQTLPVAGGDSISTALIEGTMPPAKEPPIRSFSVRERSADCLVPVCTDEHPPAGQVSKPKQDEDSEKQIVPKIRKAHRITPQKERPYLVTYSTRCAANAFEPIFRWQILYGSTGMVGLPGRTHM